MKILLVSVGRSRGPLAPAIADYERRAARYWKTEAVEVSDGVSGGRAAPERVRAAEGERILARVPAGFELIALTRSGRAFGSEELAAYLEGRALHATPGVAFVVGGAFGLDAAVLARASGTLALSSMTLPHDMARLLLAEQLYRSGTILRGEPYHKG